MAEQFTCKQADMTIRPDHNNLFDWHAAIIELIETDLSLHRFFEALQRSTENDYTDRRVYRRVFNMLGVKDSPTIENISAWYLLKADALCESIRFKTDPKEVASEIFDQLWKFKNKTFDINFNRNSFLAGLS